MLIPLDSTIFFKKRQKKQASPILAIFFLVESTPESYYDG